MLFRGALKEVGCMIIPTPHIEAKKDNFAKTVIMPGDPLRAKLIAEKYLDNAVQVTSVRGMLGYTGSYKGVRVSVMGSGMGMPSMGIYSYELFNFYDVDNIIRTGSAGALQPELDLGDIIAAMGACTNSNYASQYGLNGSYTPTADFKLLKTFDDVCSERGVKAHIGNILSSDTFYSADLQQNEKWKSMGVLAVEMETAALYMNAAYAHKNALAIFTVSDCIGTDKAMSAEERQNSFSKMIGLSLETALGIGDGNG